MDGSGGKVLNVFHAVVRQTGKLGRDRRGSVTIISAFLLPVLIGMVALVAEFGAGLLTRVENQRAADLAAFAGAVAYNASGSTTTMAAALSRVAALNGLPSSAVSGSLVTSPTGDGNQAVSVTVSSTQLLLLAPVLGSNTGLTISAGAQAEITPAQNSACILALSGSGTGVTLSGGTSVTTASCSVASNTSVSVPCGTSITTKGVNYNSSSAPSQPCNGIKPPSGTSSVKIVKASTADPLASNSGVTTAVSRLSTVSAYTAPTMVAPSTGTDIAFAYDTTSTQNAATAAGCSASYASSNSVWTLTCSGTGPFKFGNVTLGGGITVNFNTNGSSSATYNFSGSISNTGTALNFGPGTFNISKGLTAGGGTTTTFGAGTFNIGSSTSACNGSSNGTYSICHTGTTLTFGGPSTFLLPAGIYVGGGSTMTLGAGSTNLYTLGAGSTGAALSMGGGAIVKFADSSPTASVFKVVGNINVSSGGGSCLALPVAAQHDIKGFLSTAGGTLLGSGPYTVTGYVALGANGGGDVTCWGSSLGMTGTGVTLTIGAGTTIASGTCSGTSFCLAGGYANVSLTAPTTGTLAKLAVIGPTSSSNTAGATLAEGSSNTSVSGAFYVPYGPISLSGGASIGNGPGQCLQMVGSQISLGGGTAAASTCIGASGSAGTVVLVR